MKTILTVKTQHDGLMNAGFTNIKALFAFLTVDLNVKKGEIDEKKFTYSNLTKTIRESQSKGRFCVAIIYTDLGEIEIDEITIVSK